MAARNKNAADSDTRVRGSESRSVARRRAAGLSFSRRPGRGSPAVARPASDGCQHHVEHRDYCQLLRMLSHDRQARRRRRASGKPANTVVLVAVELHLFWGDAAFALLTVIH